LAGLADSDWVRWIPKEEHAMQIESKGDARATILVDADVRALDVAGTRGAAVAWRDGTILAVGTRAAAEQAAGADPIVHDARGATVLPGFIDAHHHPCIVALYGGALRLTPPDVTDVATFLECLSAAATKLPKGSWLIASDWDELHLRERRPPTRRELDDAVPDHPVLAMHYSCHRALANGRALELAGIDRHTAEPSGGAILRGPEGVPSGVLIERAMCRVERLARQALVVRDRDGFFQRLASHHAAMAKSGITRVVDATVPGDLADLYREAEQLEHLLVPTIMLPVSTAGWLEEPLDVFERTTPGERTKMLTVGPVKLVFDGAPACAMCIGWVQLAGSLLSTFARIARDRSLDPLRTVLSLEPRYGAKIETGIRIYERADARRIIAAATDHGFGVATHAIGNQAIEIALEAYEAVGDALGAHGLPRLEHAQFLEPNLVARIAAVGAAVVTQPHFLSLPAFGSAPSIPGLANAPLRWLIDAGVRVAGSSDHPVAGFSPLDGIRSAVSRSTGRGHTLEREQAIELGEALAMYTRIAAEVSGCSDECGTLEPGKRADLVVLDRALDERSLADVSVRATIIEGDLVSGTLEHA